MAERVVQTRCCCFAPTFHLYVVTCKCNIYVCRGIVTYLRTYLLTYISISCANFGPDWPLLFKVHEFDRLIFRKIIKIVAT